VGTSVKQLERHLVVVGMMGCGKSTVGRLLSLRVGADFLDTDDLVVRERGASVAEIFENEGEERFRYYESQVVRRVLALERPTVIALGGGTLLSGENQDLVRKSADSLWLKASPTTLLGRLSGDLSRPLLGSTFCEVDLETALRRREPGYETVASIVVETDHLTCDAVVERIFHALVCRAGKAERSDTVW
jgi:shikimate kinase